METEKNTQNYKQTDIIDTISESEIDTLNPHILDAIRSIQAERAGTSPIAWSDFSSHNKN